MELYANLKPGTKYASQVTKEPFKIQFVYDCAGYHIKGNGNQYRMIDLDFYLKDDFKKWRNISPQLAQNFGLALQHLLEQLDNVLEILADDERFINLTPEEKEAEQWEGNRIGFWDWHLAWELKRNENLKDKLEHLARILPTKEPNPERY